MSELLNSIQKSRETLKQHEYFLLERLAQLVPTNQEKIELVHTRKEKISPEVFLDDKLKNLLNQFFTLLTNDEFWNNLVKISQKEKTIGEAINGHLDEVTDAYLGMVAVPTERLFQKAKTSHLSLEDKPTLLKKEPRVDNLIKVLQSFQALVRLTTKSEKMDTADLSQVAGLQMHSRSVKNQLKSLKWAKEFLKTDGAFLTEMGEVELWESLQEQKHFSFIEILGKLKVVKNYLGALIQLEETAKASKIDASLAPELEQGHIALQQLVLGELRVLIYQLRPVVER